MNELINIKIKFIFVGILTMILFQACETEFIPEGTELAPEIVVEGFIEAGSNAGLPYIFLTKSVPFFSEFDPNEIENLFEHDAAINVFDGEKNYNFQEVCINDLPDILKPIVAERFGFDPDSLDVNVCVYIESSGELKGEIGKQYDLEIQLADQRVLTASTTIPEHVPLNDLWFVKPAEEAPDSLLELRATISDIPQSAEFYRYFTGINDGGYMAPFQSVVDDAFFDGEEFEFPLAKAESEVVDLESFGLFHLGDTAQIKWANLDAAHYAFWSTLEFNAVSQGPFSSYTQVETNISGGLGIWGGYSISEYEIIVNE